MMDRRPTAVDVVTLPYPGFATDLQPLVIALNSIADGAAMVTENIFEGRFVFVNELARLGADVRTDGHHAVVRGRAAPLRGTGARQRHPGRRRADPGRAGGRGRHPRQRHLPRRPRLPAASTRRCGTSVPTSPGSPTPTRSRRPLSRQRAREQPAGRGLVLAEAPSAAVLRWSVASCARMPASSSRCRDTSPSTNVPGEAIDSEQPVVVARRRRSAVARPATSG